MGPPHQDEDFKYHYPIYSEWVRVDGVMLLLIEFESRYKLQLKFQYLCFCSLMMYMCLAQFTSGRYSSGIEFEISVLVYSI